MSDFERENDLDRALSGQSHEDRVIDSVCAELNAMAVDLKISHTVNGEWPESEGGALAEHDHLKAMAVELRKLKTARVQSGEVEPVQVMDEDFGEGVIRVKKIPYQPAPTQGLQAATFAYLRDHLNEINKAEESDRDRDLERHLDIALQALSATPQPEAGADWVRCDERLPTEADADFQYRLWCWFPERGDMKLVLMDQIFQAHMSGLKIQWKPTGLTRPQPPQVCV